MTLVWSRQPRYANSVISSGKICHTCFLRLTGPMLHLLRKLFILKIKLIICNVQLPWSYTSQITLWNVYYIRLHYILGTSPYCTVAFYRNTMLILIWIYGKKSTWRSRDHVARGFLARHRHLQPPTRISNKLSGSLINKMKVLTNKDFIFLHDLRIKFWL